MTTGYLLAHDLGTSGNKATLFDASGRLVASTVCGYGISYPRDRWVEQDPADWWSAVCTTTRELLDQAGISPTRIEAVSFSAQMMGCLLLGRDGEPLRPMVTWADTRAQKQESWMIAQVGMERGYRITGHRLSASYSAAKLLWIKENEPDAYAQAWKMVHAKDYVIYRLTGKLVTDFSDASSTNLLDIEQKVWSPELVDAFQIRPDLLPELHASTDVAGLVTTEAAEATGLAEGTPVVIGGGDGSCAAVGAGVVDAGRAYNVIGTSSWISTAASAPYFDPAMRTFNWVHLDPDLYTPCGTMQAAGLSYQWYRDTMCAEEITQAEIEGNSVYSLIDAEAAAAPVGSGGLLFLPYLIGERSPWWNHDARGAFVGLRASMTKGYLSRSVLEGVGYNLRIIKEALAAQQQIGEISMIGGGAKGRVWLQILSDIWGVPLAVPRFQEEATSMGAAICAGVGIGLYQNFKECSEFNPINTHIEPNAVNRDRYDRMYDVFQQAYHALVPTFESMASQEND
ncbi:MAG: xylulokinase [Scrofimicrobium sp.]